MDSELDKNWEDAEKDEGNKTLEDLEEDRRNKTGWCRDDREFFKAGACHVLAHVFLATVSEQGFQAYLIRPIILGLKPGGSHVFVSKGDCAFDYRGYSSRAKLIEQYVTNERSKAHDERREYLHRIVDCSIPLVTSEFCRVERFDFFDKFPAGVRTRARNYIMGFPRL